MKYSYVPINITPKNYKPSERELFEYLVFKEGSEEIKEWWKKLPLDLTTSWGLKNNGNN